MANANAFAGKLMEEIPLSYSAMADRCDPLEPAVILDTFVQGVGRAEEVSPSLFRVSYFASQRGHDCQEQVCVAKFIVTADTTVAMANATRAREASHRLLGESHSPMN